MRGFDRKILSVLLVAGLLSATLAVADAQSSLDKGIIQYQRENYDEALGFLKAAREEEPQSTRVAYYLGLTYKKMQDYLQAKFFLTQAVEGTPKIQEALLELIEVCYQLDDIESAKRWIAVAEDQGLRPGQTSFIKGLVLMKNGETEEAVRSFRDAKDLEPSLKQNADFQIGLAHLKDKSFDDAEKSFQEVIQLDPNTDIARYADEYKKALDRRREGGKPFNLSVGLFEEYDDNVILKPGDESSIGAVGNQEDWREVVTFGAELSRKFNGVFGASVRYDFYGAKQNDLHAFDVNSHTVGVAPSVYFGEHAFSVPVQYNRTWVDDDDFLSTVTVNPLVNLKLAENQLGQLGVKFQDKNYLQTPVFDAENRDAFRWAPGAGWFYFFNENKSFVNFRYEFDAENTKGTNWDYEGHRLSAALQIPFCEKWKATAAGDAYWQDFDHVNTFFNVKRSDDNTTGSVMLSYAIAPWVEWQLRYTYVDHRSDISIYQYTRNIVSTGLSAKF